MNQFNRKKLFFPVLFLLAFIQACSGVSSEAPEQTVSPASVKSDSFNEKWGIEITSVRMTANDHMVDFRFRVIDSEKAGALFDRQTKPYLVEQESGKVLAVPNTAKVGPLRNSNTPKEGKIYWMFFGNRSGLVHPGSKVAVVIGDFKAENLVVE